MIQNFESLKDEIENVIIVITSLLINLASVVLQLPQISRLLLERTQTPSS